ncbi:MAG: GNAT family N-acetyltransferase [Verrucomicrobiota bacterium]|nr:GNAT family N-acetyltransferase [Verrucomicrobiota bacterium]
MPRLRPATNADGDTVRTLVFEVLREYGLPPDPEGTDADLSEIEQHYRNGWFSVLEVDGQIIGSVGLLPQEETVMELCKMYLHCDWRGRGLGRLLLEKALDEAQKRGARRVVLGTARVLGEAVALYEQSGFQPSQEKHTAPRVDQTWELDL